MITTAYLNPLYRDFYSYLSMHGIEKTQEYYTNNARLTKEHKSNSFKPHRTFTLYRSTEGNNGTVDIMVIFKYEFYMCASYDIKYPFIMYSNWRKHYEKRANGLMKFHFAGQPLESTGFLRRIYFPNTFDPNTFLPTDDTFIEELFFIMNESLDEESVRNEIIYNKIA